MKHKIILILLLISGLAIKSSGQNIVMGTSTALGESSVAFGDSSLAVGYASIAAGSFAKANGDFTLSLGDRTIANGKWSQALGFGSRTDGEYSFGAGFFNYISPEAGFGVGIGAANEVRGAGGLAIGRDNFSYGVSGAVIGTRSTSRTYGETVLGAYAEDIPDSLIAGTNKLDWRPQDRLFVVANGFGDGAGVGTRRNAMVMIKNGDTQFNGQVNIRGQYFLPGADGNHGDVLKTNGEGDLVWLPTDINPNYAGALNVNMLIPDGDEVEKSIEIGGAGTIDADTKIMVCLDIKHVDLDELEIQLIAPNDIINLSNGALGSDYNSTCFSSASTQLLSSDVAPYSGVYEPDESFSSLYGGDINGTWSLRVKDIGGQPILGFFNNWSLVVYNPDESATVSSNNADHGFVAEQNELSGVVAKENVEYGFESEKNTLSGYYAFDNDEHGMLAFENDKSGIVSKENVEYGFESKKNQLSGYYAFDNDENGFLAKDNQIGFKATGAGIGFESETLGVGFKVDQPGGLLGFETNSASGFKANSAQTGYESIGASTAFKSTGGVTGLDIAAGIAAKLTGGVSINGPTVMTGSFTGQEGYIATLAKGAGTFKIDHPLDPENKYLYHSFVESPDMMNIYNGNVILDADGTAVVEMADWFEALNMEFRYQLTFIGGFAQVYIADKVKDGKFKISGGSPGLEVSWQVTGIRQDPYAVKNRIQVEVEKEEEYKGSYLNADAYDQPKNKSAQFVREQLSNKKVAEAIAKTQVNVLDNSQN